MPTIDPSRNYQDNAKRVFNCLQDGGIAIVYMDVAYAIMSGSEEALHRVYKAKKRSIDKPSGVVANLRTHDEVQLLSDEAKHIVRTIVMKHDLPLSVIAPYRNDHPLMKQLTPFLTGLATKDDTVNFLLNAGPLRDHIAEFSLEHSLPLIASSANVSQRGTKYRAEDIEPEIRAAADVIIDYGPSTYMENGLKGDFNFSSTQIDFRTMRLVRKGIFFDSICAVLENEFGITLNE
ncbi:MAG: Sua5/YciO/YrdC/YwlC family protein [Rhodospirillales bacterium]|jgi:tRNA A37 threonylcarbamoyladenosine synthetase subunit TsaC/SUA5/YrdC